MEVDKETEILSRLAANHLFLGQFEPLRAIIIALRARNPTLALAVLQTIVAHSGRFENVLWSPSCPSPAILTYLSTVELLQFDNASSAWGFDPETLRLRAEFLLLVQSLIDRVSESLRKGFDLESIEKEKEKSDGFEELMDGAASKELRDGGGELERCVRLLDRMLELGVNRLKPESLAVVSQVSGGDGSESSLEIEEGELMCLRSLVWENADVFDALCWNVQRQVRGWEGDDASGMAITVRRDDMPKEEDVTVFRMIQRSVQLAHLDAMKECIKDGQVDGVVSRIRFLHLDYGVEETEYRIALQDLLKMVSSGKEGYGDSWRDMREKLLQIYSAALASSCGHLVKMIQVLQDELLSKEIEMYRYLDNNQIPPPLERLQRYLEELKPGTDVNDKTSPFSSVVAFCMRDMHHYARVSGLHLLECVIKTALSVVKREQLQEASNILLLFPRLQPLVAAMGWDLLSGKTAARRKLMQLLWKTKSQVLRSEESSLYSNQSDEISCVEYLCDSLCYQLDLASFVACVNSGQSWNSKLSLTLSAEDQIAYNGEGAQLDPFVENFVLERLSAQSPLRVLFDVVPGIKFKDAIELISMQPIASTLEARKRMQDIELMHMRYALDSAVLALGVMEKSMTAESHQVAFCYLKDLQNHLEAVNTIPRKIMIVNVIISLLHMDDQSLNLNQCASPENYSEAHYTCASEQINLTTYEGGNELVISFTGKLLEILHHCLPSTIADLDHAVSDGIKRGGRQAVEWRVSIAKHFIEEWEWRLSILQRLLPLSERQWKWKEALTVLRAAPSKLLNLSYLSDVGNYFGEL